MAERIASKRDRVHSEINLAPFVDVLLVLLLVFVVAAPIATVAVNFELLGYHGPSVPGPPVYVSLRGDGVIYVGESVTDATTTDWSAFPHAMEKTTGADRNRPILVRADQEVPYAEVMRLANELDRMGYRNKVLVTEDAVD